MIRLSNQLKQVITKSLTSSLEAKGIVRNTLTQDIEQALNNESTRKDYKWRPATNLFFDWGWLYGLNDRDVREPMKRKAPSLRELIDFYTHPRITTLGSHPFQTLFLSSEWRKYGLDEYSRRQIEQDVKESLGSFGYAMLIDTMNMIMTGSRDVPINSLVTYMEQDLSDVNLLVEERFCRKELSELTQEEFLHKWISTKKGMYDCIEMHRLVFNIY